MKDAIAALFRSRKFIVTLSVGIIGAVFVGLGKVPIEHYGNWVVVLSSALILAIAHEDAGAKGAGLSAPAASVATALALPEEEATKP